MSANNPIDKHFRDHLSDVQVEPSANLWSKMEPRLEEKHSNKGWFIGIAASIAFAFAVSSFLFNSYNQSDIPAIQDITIEPENEIETTPSTPLPIDVKETETPESTEYEEPIEIQSIATESRSKAAPTQSYMPTIVGRDGGESAMRTTALNSSSETLPTQTNRTFADASSEVNRRVRFDPNKYIQEEDNSELNATQDLAASSTPAATEEKIRLNEYAERQLENIISLKPLEAPKRDEIKWPEMSINISPLVEKFTPNRDHSATQP